MPHPTTARPLRQILQPMIAGALLASSHPSLTAHGIEVDHLGIATGNDPLGLRVFLYHPSTDVFEQWTEAINATECSVPRTTSRPGEISRTASGRIGNTPVEVTCVSLRDEWVWRTVTGGEAHRRDITKDGSVAACGELIVGVVDPAQWGMPGLRCHGCVSAGTGPSDVL
ncbi:hypothetical protein [Streptomyces sp. NPDC059378]|uniref:hypothetical protein n=1 Tax=Streptomyces sp. NPDC059378 TaxID=3346815 RepID=UPI0036CB1F36